MIEDNSDKEKDITSDSQKNRIECELCGKEFGCEMSTGHCWCMELPPLKVEKATEQCICPDCLKKYSEE